MESVIISTHTPLARRDRFQADDSAGRVISTHTPLARRDVNTEIVARAEHDFYSHASREA